MIKGSQTFIDFSFHFLEVVFTSQLLSIPLRLSWNLPTAQAAVMHTMNMLQAKAVGSVFLNMELSQSPDIPKDAQLGCSLSRQPRMFITLFQTYTLHPRQAARLKKLLWACGMPYYSPWNIPVFVLEKLLILPHFPSKPDCSEHVSMTVAQVSLGAGWPCYSSSGPWALFSQLLCQRSTAPGSTLEEHCSSLFLLSSLSVFIPFLIQPESVCQHYILFGKKIIDVHHVREGTLWSHFCLGGVLAGTWLLKGGSSCSISPDPCMRKRFSGSSLALLLLVPARENSSRYFRHWNCGMRGQDNVFHNIRPSQKMVLFYFCIKHILA